MSLGGRHGHKIRRLRRRIDAVLEEERERRKPPPPPISEEHAAMRERIARLWDTLYEQIPEGTDLDEAMDQIPELAELARQSLRLARQERDFLASQGVDPRPYDRY
jgi:hypothetical protein